MALPSLCPVEAASPTALHCCAAASRASPVAASGVPIRAAALRALGGLQGSYGGRARGLGSADGGGGGSCGKFSPARWLLMLEDQPLAVETLIRVMLGDEDAQFDRMLALLPRR
jgi:hypothetical protein